MRIIRLELASNDLPAAAAFYRSVLGLPVQESRDSVVVRAGATELRIVQGTPTDGANHVAFTIPKNQLASAKSWLSPRAEMLSREGADQFPLQDPWDSESIYFLGPDDMVLEFIARNRLDNAAPAPFTPEHILYVSEVGVAVPDVAAAVRQLNEELGLPAFAGDNKTFHAVGGHEGLLILVCPGRPWFPTETAVSSFSHVAVDVADVPRAGTVVSAGGWRLTTVQPLARHAS